MILELDIGNSRIKWRSLGGSPAKGVLQHDDQAALTALRHRGDAATLIRVANVAGESMAKQLEQWWGNGKKLMFATTEASAAGVINSYPEPSKMGVDRWLAMLAAYHQSQGACCVIDCGSAITFDVVGPDGQHQGGYIVPGVRLLKQSLMKDTENVHFDAGAQPASLQLGKNTTEAVNHGIFSLASSWLNKLVADFLSDYPTSSGAIYLTGGDAGMIAAYLEHGATIQAELVMDGLALALPSQS